MKRIIIIVLVLLNIPTLHSQDKIVMYWDISYSMKDRDLAKDLQFLDNYFKKNTNAQLTLKMFNNKIVDITMHSINYPDWNSLKEKLKETIYDGSTEYSSLFSDDADQYLLFTDGLENMDLLEPKIDNPLYIVSSAPKSDIVLLNNLAKKNNGLFIYLNPTKTVNTENFDFQNKELENKVIGTVSTEYEPLHNVSVFNKTNNKNVATDTNGTYEIEAKEGDILVFTYLGKKTVNIRIVDTGILNISMLDINNSLDEVTINTTIEKSNDVETGFGMVNKDKLGYQAKTILAEDLAPGETDAAQSVVGHFSNLKLPQTLAADRVDLSQFQGRSTNTMLLNKYGLIVIDGVPQEISNSTRSASFKSNIGSMINPDNIASITYLKGFAATNRYGTLGSNGVLLITTKTAQGKKPTISNDTPIGITGTYSENVSDIGKLPNKAYIRALSSTESLESAYNKYLQLREELGNNPEFYMDVSQYFRNENQPNLTNQIMSNIIEIASDNAKWLRAVAYKYQETGEFKEASEVFELITFLEPNESQTYLDLAVNETYLGNYKKAAQIYKNILNLNNVGSASFVGLSKTLDIEIKNLVSLSDEKLYLGSEYDKPVKYRSRIIFEWNDHNAEFDVDIVNPENRYFTWSNTLDKSRTEFIRQQQEGFGIMENFLTASDKGLWKFNLKYFGNQSSDPSYLKITTIDYFGDKSQKVNIKVVKLDEKDIEQRILGVEIN